MTFPDVLSWNNQSSPPGSCIFKKFPNSLKWAMRVEKCFWIWILGYVLLFSCTGTTEVWLPLFYTSLFHSHTPPYCLPLSVHKKLSISINQTCQQSDLNTLKSLLYPWEQILTEGLRGFGCADIELQPLLLSLFSLCSSWFSITQESPSLRSFVHADPRVYVLLQTLKCKLFLKFSHRDTFQAMCSQSLPSHLSLSIYVARNLLSVSHLFSFFF
jgi:hypothetical protein